MHAALEGISDVYSRYMIIIIQNDLFSVRVFCMCRLSLYDCRVYRYGPRKVPWPVLIFEGTLHVSKQFDYGHLPTVQQLPDPLLQLVQPSKKYVCNCTPYLAPLYLNRIVLRGTGRQKPQDNIAFGAFNVVVHLFAGVGSCVVKYYEHFAVPVSEIFQECDYAVGIRLLMELHIERALSQHPYGLYALF